jgi:predicted acetyltransferase
MDIRGRAIDTEYIVGAATLPEYRNRGLMAGLLRESLDLLRKRGVAITHLYPFLHSFYERFGWAAYTQMAQHGIRGQKAPGYTVSGIKDAAEAARLYMTAMRPYTGYILRDEREFSKRLNEFTCDGGKSAGAYRAGAMKAYALYDKKDNAIVAYEAAYADQEALYTLLETMKEREGVKDIRAALPVRTRIRGSIARKNEPWGMARITDVLALLKLLPLAEGSFVMAVTDDFASWNNGVYEAVYTDGGAVVVRSDKQPQFSCDILSLALLIHGSINLDALTKAGKATVYDKNALESISILFPARNTFVYEAY